MLGIPVRALVRNRARAEGLSALPKVEVVEGDMGRPDRVTSGRGGVRQRSISGATTSRLAMSATRSARKRPGLLASMIAIAVKLPVRKRAR